MKEEDLQDGERALLLFAQVVALGLLENSRHHLILFLSWVRRALRKAEPGKLIEGKPSSPMRLLRSYVEGDQSITQRFPSNEDEDFALRFLAERERRDAERETAFLPRETAAAGGRPPALRRAPAPAAEGEKNSFERWLETLPDEDCRVVAKVFRVVGSDHELGFRLAQRLRPGWSREEFLSAQARLRCFQAEEELAA